MPFIYLATPYTHQQQKVMQRRYELAKSVVETLTDRGEVVYSPVVYCHPLVAGRDKQAKRRDFNIWRHHNMAFLRVCWELWVVQFAGFSESQGMAAEIELAKQLHLPIQWWKPSDFSLSED